MDRDRFDDLTRAMAGGVFRRRAVCTLFAGAIGSVAALGGSRAMAAPAARGGHKTECCPADHPTLCGLTCVDLMADPANCGTCGTSCPSGICTAGVCQPPSTFCTPGQDSGQSCSAGIGACQRDGTMVCTIDGSAFVCSAVAGQPQAETCNGLDDDCDGVIDNDATCPPLPNTTGICQSGNCTYVCVQGYADCNNDMRDGCEDHIFADINNCGACGNVCSGATPNCVSGVCST